MSSRLRWIFVAGNLLTAGLLATVLSVLPVRHALFDTVLAVLALALGASAIAMLANLAWSTRALRYSAGLLLGVGLLASGIAVLTLAFLSGVHGRWLDGGFPLTVVALGLIVPHLVVYPLVQLALTSRT